jgi:anti-sigma factor RsiW
MAMNINPQPSLDEIRELLSPYLDGEVSEEERLWVEQAIATSAELRQELEFLRQTVNLLAALPPVAAPRPFTLSEADVQPVFPASPKKSFWRASWLGSLAMTAAALICVIIAGWTLFATQSMQAPQELALHPQEESAAAPAAAEMAEGEAAPAAQEAATAVESIEVEKEVEAEEEVVIAQSVEEAEVDQEAAAEMADEAGQEEAAAEAAEESMMAAEAVEEAEPSQPEAAPAPPAGEGAGGAVAESETGEDAASTGRVEATEDQTSTGRMNTVEAPPSPTPAPITLMAAPTGTPAPPAEPNAAGDTAASETEPALESASEETENVQPEEAEQYNSQDDEAQKEAAQEEVAPLAQAQATPTATATALLLPTPTLPAVAPTAGVIEQQPGAAPSSNITSWLITGSVLLALLVLGFIIWSKLNRKS